MSSSASKFFLTTPIYYVNARPHIGHAYTTIVADVLARRSRAQGVDTFFLTGTDEHGQKIERSAQAAGIPPQQFTDRVSQEFRTLWDRMGLTYDDFIRTTEPRHKIGAQKLFAELYARGAIYLSSYTGQYCVSEEIFVEGPPGVIGPDGKPTETVTEENFFFRLGDYQLRLLDLIESDTLAITPESRKNEVLSFLRGNVVEARAAGTTIAESNAGIPYVAGALRDLSVSRSSFTWGIPVPEPAASATEKKHVMYVWLDALANYMTAVGYGTDTPEANAMFAKYWPADMHIMAKEITRQHCIYWPAFLMAAELPLPRAITAHGWLLFEDSKMSKSKGNIVRTETILDAFGTLCPPGAPSSDDGLIVGQGGVSSEARPSSPGVPTKHNRDLFASDVLRYFLLREIPFGQDGSFSFDAIITRYNADLANGYGNLVSRTLNMIHKYFDGVLPTPSTEDRERLEGVVAGVVAYDSNPLNSIDFADLLEAIWGMLASTDGYITRLAPWKLAADPEKQQALADVLYNSTEFIRVYTALAYPYLPYATANVWRQLGLGDIELAAKNGELKDLQWGGLKPGTRLGPLSPIFPRADKGLAQTMSDMETEKNLLKQAEQTDSKTEFAETPIASEKSVSSAESVVGVSSSHPAAPPRTSAFSEPNPGSQVAASTAATTGPDPSLPTTNNEQPTTPSISIDDFIKIELRVAKILVAERIPKADKLLRLEVDLGYEQRQILSGIAEWYTPEDLIGRRIVVITNLAPRKMRGLESHGMLLAASAEPSAEGEKPGKPCLATFAESDDLPLGSRLK